MIAFKWDDKVKRTCRVRGVDVGIELFQTGIINTEGVSKFPTNSPPTEMDFDDLPDIIQARVTMFMLVKPLQQHIEGVGVYATDGNVYSFMYIYEEE
jgi:hypothetical protein